MDTETRNQSTYFISAPYKSMAASILLTLFLGPVGLLYSSFLGALIMTVLIVPGLLIPLTRMTVLPFMTFWLICSFWGAFSTNRYNKKLLARYMSISTE